MFENGGSLIMLWLANTTSWRISWRTAYPSLSFVK